MFSRSRSSIANILRLLKLPQAIHEYIIKGHLSEGHARTLIDFSEDEQLCLQLADEIISKKLSVRQAEKLVKSFKKPTRVASKQLHLFDNYIEKLSEKLKTDVQIKHRKNQLTLSVSYGRFKDYIAFLDQLCTIEISPFES